MGVPLAPPRSSFLSFLPALSTGSSTGKAENKEYRGWRNTNTYDPKLEDKAKVNATRLETMVKDSHKEDRKTGGS